MRKFIMLLSENMAFANKQNGVAALKDAARVDISSIGYGNGLTAVQFGPRLLLFSTEYLIGKHGTNTSSAGSKLGNVDSEAKLLDLLKSYIDEDILAKCEGVIRLPNLDSGHIVGNDALVEIVSLTKGGKTVPLGSELKEGVDYSGRVKDADGNIYDAVVRYEITRPGSPDGKFPAIMQPVAYTQSTAPSTRKLNIVVGEISLDDPDAASFESEALRKKLGGSLDKVTRVYGVFTIFPGTYSPAANEPLSSQVDPILGTTGNKYWSTHALMKSQE